ncbi:MAG: hypothetical protein JKX72_12385 [Robiginitomaculum sp.]|nr:hypothetical protein [Robiginitomaculum sp.]
MALNNIASDLSELLKLRSIPIGMKKFKNIADMEAIHKIRRPTDVHTLDQVVGQDPVLVALSVLHQMTLLALNAVQSLDWETPKIKPGSQVST